MDSPEDHFGLQKEHTLPLLQEYQLVDRIEHGNEEQTREHGGAQKRVHDQENAILVETVVTGWVVQRALLMVIETLGRPSQTGHPQQVRHPSKNAIQEPVPERQTHNTLCAVDINKPFESLDLVIQFLSLPRV